MKALNQAFFEIIHQRHEGILLSDFLKFSMPTISIDIIDQIIKEKNCLIDAVLVNADIKLQQGQKISWTVKEYVEGFVDTSWKLLWESEEILAVHKPANLPVHKTTRNVINTLVKLVQRESKFKDAHLLHRLDLDTSGIVLLAKTNEFAQFWQPKLKELMVKKVYRAVVYGKPNWEKLEFECFLNTDKESEIRCKMHVQDSGKKSHTHFKVINSSNNYSIIECELITGRKHQIRAHLSHLGHPIVGDKIYSNNGEYYLKRLNDDVNVNDEEELQTSHHLLMAYQVDLNINDNEYSIKDENFSEQWMSFCNKNGL